MNTLLHVTADGYDADLEALCDKQAIDQYFKQINTSAFSHIIHYKDPYNDYIQGNIGVLLLPGTHTTIHTYTHAEKACYFYDFFNYDPLLHEQRRSVLEGSYKPILYTSSYCNRDTATRSYDFSQTSPLTYYGPHLMIRAQAPQHICQRAAFIIEDFLWKLPQLIGMHPLTKPYLVESETWLSSIRVIAESHLSVHLEKASGILYIDIFSCKKFEEYKVVEHICNTFMCTIQDVTLLYRGTHFHTPHTDTILNALPEEVSVG